MYECEANLFAGKGNQEYQVWTLCNNCAKKYLVPNSPIIYIGKAIFNEQLKCDGCNSNIQNKRDTDSRINETLIRLLHIIKLCELDNIILSYYISKTIRTPMSKI